jgi:anti-sigma B factor antagonist
MHGGLLGIRMEGCLPLEEAHELAMTANRWDDLRKTLLIHGADVQPDALEITVADGEEGKIVNLNGRVNFDSSPALRYCLLAMLQGLQSVVVDLTRVSYIDSSGIATLIEGLKIAHNRQIRFCLNGLEGRLLHLFEVTGVLALFERHGCRSASPEPKVS